MPDPRRILSLWFPHLAAERLLRRNRGLLAGPFAVVSASGPALTLTCLSPEAVEQGLRVGQSLSDARALCPDLTTAPEDPAAQAAFLSNLCRWAGRYTPWVAAERPSALVLDITGCAHLFGGETGLAAQIRDDLLGLRLTASLGIADTLGAAWALARFAGAEAGAGAGAHRSGDAIAQEARATRSRAFRRRPPGAPLQPAAAAPGPEQPFIAPPGQSRAALEGLPVAALRLDRNTVADLNRVGVRHVADLLALPRAALARRFGQPTLARLDQAMGAVPEPVSPLGQRPHFATRLTLPDPIGLAEDITAGIDRLLPPLCARLETRRRGARQLRLTCFRADRSQQVIELGLARPSHDPARIRPLLILRLGDIDPGFGIDVLRLEAYVTEPLSPQQHAGHADAVARARALRDNPDHMADLLGRLGARIGLDRLIRLHPADSHIPEKTATRMAAAYTAPAENWPMAPEPADQWMGDIPRRPALLFPPEIVQAQDPGRPPQRFRWRRRLYRVASASGPERISPEWWLDDPAWRSGTRDYWRVETTAGERLWLFEARRPTGSGGWFCQGDFG